MNTIVIQGTAVNLPPLCACCLRDATHEVTIGKVKRTEMIVAAIKSTVTLKVPHCEPCSRHVTWSTASVVAHAIVLALLLLLIGFIASALVAFSYEPSSGVQTLIFLAGAGLLPALGTWVYVKHKERNRPDDLLGPEHTRPRVALEILDFTKDSITLGIHNERYAQTVSSLNPVIQPGVKP
jgi:hypothetical protein